MRPLRVLQLGTYPIEPRIHGGQRRAGAIWDAYRRNGVQAEYAAIIRPTCRGAAGRRLFPVGPSTAEQIDRRPGLEDVILGEQLDRDPICRVPLLAFWNRFQPDLVQLEQPFAWPAVQRLMAGGQVARVPVIYSSQNVEFEMKAAMGAQTLPAGERAAASRAVRRVEEDLVRQAAMVIAVTQEDADAFRKLGARHCVVVHNGHAYHPPRPGWVRRWQDRLGARGKRKFALFVSSNHPPNYLGFKEMLGPYLGYLPPDAEVLVAGGICYHGPMHEGFGPGSLVNGGRTHLLGDALSDDDIAALLQLADVVLLPITSGGGSNLKTVQALLSGRPMLATPRAFRSFEEFAELPRVRLAETPELFHRELQRVTLDPASHDPLLVSAPAPELEPLTWRFLGDAFVQHVTAWHSRQAA